ncbi:hypothetical protein CHA01nite_20440 [Chryseobacterium hagamense]|uniref:Uncharacterized protein n=2 Tax=Chryseobacterium hagamense TaxID=395935 RepID=A0A511YM78_9FLAO|nr:hypothetical protein CHA01nite_20440 [Chryseobacterium hagamense]
MVISEIIFAQNWKDKVFDQVILIKDENVFWSGKLILIDIPIKINDRKELIFYNASHLPNKLFFDKEVFLPRVNKFTLIAPDKEYYDGVRDFANKIKGCAEPMKTDKFYFVNRNEIKWDSISLNDSDYPTVNFKNHQVAKNEIISYYAEGFGSVCCPRDRKREYLKDNGNAAFFRKLKDKGIAVKESYSCCFGEEGEYSAFYPLREFSNEQKMIFINERLEFFHENPENYRILFPEIISYPNLKLNTLNY